jgi:hypothetical protein
VSWRRLLPWRWFAAGSSETTSRSAITVPASPESTPAEVASGKTALEPAPPDAAAETDLRSAIHSAYIEAAKGKLDRVASAASFVTTAAGAIGTIYTGLLALVYSVASTPARPLPARGLAPAVFLALAFFFSVLNIAFIRSSGERRRILPVAETWRAQEARLVTYLLWIEAGATRRAWALRVAVVCLGAAVALLPLPFVSLSATATGITIGIVAGVATGYFAYEMIAMFWPKKELGTATSPGAGPRPKAGR